MVIKKDGVERAVAHAAPAGHARSSAAKGAGAGAPSQQQQQQQQQQPAPMPPAAAASSDSGGAGPSPGPLPPGFVESAHPMQQPRKVAIKTPLSSVAAVAAAAAAVQTPPPAAPPLKRRPDATDAPAADAGSAPPSKRPRATDAAAAVVPQQTVFPAAAAQRTASPHADVASFLRGIRPKLSCLEDSIAALPRSGISMAHLAAAAAAKPAAQERALKTAAEALRIRLHGDKMALEMALDKAAAEN
jgi:hypothetical protein